MEKEDRVKVFTAVLLLIGAIITSPLLTFLLPKISDSQPVAIEVSSNASDPIYIGDSIKSEGDDSNPKNIITLSELNKRPEIQKVEFSSPSPYTIHSPSHRGQLYLAYRGSTTVQAIANDPEGEPIVYKFSLKGPTTDYKWEPKRDWAVDSSWFWEFNEK